MRLGCALLALSLAAAGAAMAAEEPARAEEPPVQIRSDRLRVFQKKNRAVFEGSVEATQGDLSIRCQRLEVQYAPAEEGAEDGRGGSDRAIRRMVFSGDVQIVQKARRGHCQRAEYDRTAGRIVCTGKPWVHEGENRIRGERILYLLDRDEVHVTRPRAQIRVPAREQEPESERERAP
ncbi:MAG: hypothetical protein JXR96_12130 [Deltaproteobacteria bacterium]|nr:hypothetical protein [Deltaproteobacteria bacterium]